eukprot:Macronucleus_6375.p2 GENE.Macronucleus_6375~~Macronucleus_6375.p2  ORF type:complete len:150 (+),score=19.64 Macronucleus_6375:1-450(+)
MAHLTLQHSFNKVEGVSVDTHVHRISGRLGWVKNAATPGKTAEQLEAWLPKDKWVSVNHLLVGFGQTICKPIGPRCWQCKVAKLCPMRPKNKAPGSASATKKKKAVATDSEESKEETEEEVTEVAAPEEKPKKQKAAVKTTKTTKRVKK